MFLSFSSELLNSSYWHPVLFTFFPLRQRYTFLGYLTEDCFSWELTLLRRRLYCLPQSLPFQQQFLVWPHQEPSSWLCYYLWVWGISDWNYARALPLQRMILDPPTFLPRRVIPPISFSFVTSWFPFLSFQPYFPMFDWQIKHNMTIFKPSLGTLDTNVNFLLKRLNIIRIIMIIIFLIYTTF